MPRFHFSFGQHAVRGEKRHIFFVQKMLERVRRGAQVGKAAALRFSNPCVIISIAVEDDPLVLFDGITDQIV